MTDRKPPSPYKGRRITCDLADGLRLIICIRGVTGMNVADVQASEAENGLALYDGLGNKLAGAKIGTWEQLFVRKSG